MGRATQKRKKRPHLDLSGDPGKRSERQPEVQVAAPESSQEVTANEVATVKLSPIQISALAVFSAVFVWAYWPTLKLLVDTWNREPDYSHGFLVPVFAVVFLWIRRDVVSPLLTKPAIFGGLVMLAACLVLRAASALFYVEVVDGWSMIPCLAAIALFVGGWSALKWSWPSIAFLLFAIPLPFKGERALSLPLQGIATRLSSYMLQALGQPAITEGHTIVLNEYHLEVEQACSGLRIFMAIFALAFAYVVLTRTEWWEKAILMLVTIPIALLANALRIVATGLLLQYASSEAAHKFAHDFAGWAMIPVAAAMFMAVIWYLRLLFREVYVLDVRDALRRA